MTQIERPVTDNETLSPEAWVEKYGQRYEGISNGAWTPKGPGGENTVATIQSGNPYTESSEAWMENVAQEI